MIGLLAYVSFLIQYGNGNKYKIRKVKLNSQQANTNPGYNKKEMHGKKNHEFSVVCFGFSLEAMKSINPISSVDNTRIIA